MHLVLYPLPVPPTFLKGGWSEISKKLGRVSNLKKICVGNQKGEGRRDTKVIGRFFIFNFSLLVMMVTDTVFRESSIENLF